MSFPKSGTWNANLAKPSRRGFIQAGWLGSLGLSLGAFLKLEADAKAAEPTKQLEAKAKSVIHIYLQGGFAHMDSFDPKPDAPLNIAASWTRSRRNFRAYASVSTWQKQLRLPTSSPSCAV